MKWKFWQASEVDFEPAEAPEGNSPVATFTRITSTVIGLYLIATIVIGVIWSKEPNGLGDLQNSTPAQTSAGTSSVTGSTTTATFIAVAETLLNKSGGYLSNDIFPPGVWLDNMRNWEFGALTLLRDTARVYRNDISGRKVSPQKTKTSLKQRASSFLLTTRGFCPARKTPTTRALSYLRTINCSWVTTKITKHSSMLGRIICSNGFPPRKLVWAACRKDFPRV